MGDENEDADSLFVITTTPFNTKESDFDTFVDETSSTFHYDTSCSTNEDEIYEIEEDDFMIDEKNVRMNAKRLSSSLFDCSEFDIAPKESPLENPHTTTSFPETKLYRKQQKRHGSSWCRRPPFHVTSMYLWTQFNVSYIFRKLSFFFDTNYHNNSDHPLLHLMTIHYIDSGVVDVIVMNLIMILFLSTSYMYRTSRPLLRAPNTTHAPDTTRTPLQRRRQNRSTTYLLECVTLITFLLLILRLRGAAMNVLIVSIIYMFLHLIHSFFQSSSPSLSSSSSSSSIIMPSSLIWFCN
jgi:hypothetical protein